MTILSAMTGAEKSIRRCFVRQLVKVDYIMSPGYVLLLEPLRFVCAMVVLLAEGRFDVAIPTPHRQVDPNLYYPFRSELPAVWSDISSAIQVIKDDSKTRVVLDKGLGLGFS